MGLSLWRLRKTGGRGGSPGGARGAPAHGPAAGTPWGCAQQGAKLPHAVLRCRQDAELRTLPIERVLLCVTPLLITKMIHNFGDKRSPVYPGSMQGGQVLGHRVPRCSHLLPGMDQKDTPLVHSGEIFIKLGKSPSVAKTTCVWF